MRRIIAAASLTVSIATGGSARADLPKCDDNKKTNCLRGGVLVLDGGELGVDMCQYQAGAGHTVCITPGVSLFNAAQDKAAKLIAASGVATKWDTVVIFTANFTPGNQGDPMVFNRIGGSPEAGSGYVNPVKNIGIPAVNPYKAGTPWVGYITGSNTLEFGIYKAPSYDPPAGSGYLKWPEPDPSVGNFRDKACATTGYCYGFSYNAYQALAQATATMYGPRLMAKAGAPAPMTTTGLDIISLAEVDGGVPSDGGTGGMGGGGMGGSTPDSTSSDISLAAAAKSPALRTQNEARVWSSFLDMESTLMGGNNWVENGNRTAQTGQPSQHWFASPPFQGKPVLRFAPLDLYMLGFVPPTDAAVPPVTRYSWAITDMVWPQQQPSFSATYGPAMGLKNPGEVFFYSDQKKLSPVKIQDVVDAMGGEREPKFSDASNLHMHRQLWVVVSNPKGTDDENNLHIARLARWRVQWDAYFYMLASYQGRMVTTVDDAGGKPVDDNPYWEFAQPTDDMKDWSFDGLSNVAMKGPEKGANIPIVSTKVVADTDGSGSMKYTGARLALRVNADSSDPSFVNTAVVRMKIPVGGPKDAAAHLKMGDLDVRIPASVSNDAKKQAYLVADGQFHNYNADLTKLSNYGGSYTDLSFVPSDKAVSGVEIEFIRLKYLDDKQIEDDDQKCDGTHGGDGWVAAEDNCPLYYNPDQQDIDGNGIGDACEDFDADNVINSCDNCPTKTNSRQRDSNKNGVGDVCDGAQDTGCFLMPDSLGGRTGTRVAIPLLLGLSATIGTLVVRRRRRR